MNDRALSVVHAAPIETAAIEQVLAYGDLTKLSSGQRTAYYSKVCESLGLNPLTRPFEFINLSGKLVFYARRDCTDQLRRIHAVSVRIVSRENTGDVFVVTAQASLPDGRVDESTGAVPIANLKGEMLANALMKAETKAKRRVTLSICGLSVLDESELDGASSGVRQDLQQLGTGAHSPHDDGAAPPEGDCTLYDPLHEALQTVENSLAGCDTYDKALELRGILGTSAQQSQLTKSIQSVKGELSVTQNKELGRLWQKCNRSVAKLEKELATSAEGVAHGDDPAEDFDR
ncbi:MAG: hypothetical protein V4739_17465 [Pseudomonadota bacterium]